MGEEESGWSGDDYVARAICDYCGEYITEPGQKCPALADGQCEP